MPKPITHLEFFCGTGGVGKSTLSAARAAYLASKKNNKILLVTIDPSRRLKDLLGLEEEGVLQAVRLQASATFDAYLMNPSTILDDILKQHLTRGQSPTRILNLLGDPYGGLHDLLSLVKLAQYYREGKYHVIVVDTAPGKHFLDFLSGIETIHQFFDHPWLKKMPNLFEPQRSLIGKFFQHALDKLLVELYKVTGQSFVQEFIETLKQVSSLKTSFIGVLDLVGVLAAKEQTHFFLTLQSEHQKFAEITQMQQSLQLYDRKQFTYLYNRALTDLLQPELSALPPGPWKNLSQALIEKEQRELTSLKKMTDQVLVFPKQLPSSEFMEQLMAHWSKYHEN